MQKKVFKDIIIVTVVILSVLPVIVTFSAFLTRVFDNMRWYGVMQKHVVPVESKLVAVIIKGFGIESKTVNSENYSLVLFKDGKEYIPIRLEWNCLGWQSLILLSITFATGLRGKHKISSKIEAVIIGVFGTFLVNLFRMAVVAGIAFYASTFGAFVVHDYLASFVALVWMIFFWWFSYSYVLDPIQDPAYTND